MSKLFKDKVKEEVAKSYKKGRGHLDVRFNNESDTNRFEVRLAEERTNKLLVEFALFEGPEGPLNVFIAVDINKNALSQKIEFPNNAAGFLYQSATEEWRPEKGWIRGEWNPDSRKFEGIMGDVESDLPGTTKVTWAKFDVTID